MVKKTNYLLSGALALLTALPVQNVSAQLGLRPAGVKVKEVMAKVKPGQANAKQKAFEVKHPLLTQVKNFGTPKPTLNKGLKEMKVNYVRVKSASAKSGVAKAPSLAAATGRELWGNVAYQTGWSSDYTAYGMYTFNAASPIEVSPITLNDNLQAVGGGALVDGIFHEINYFSFWGMLFMTHYAFDTATWEQTVSESVDDYAMLGKETAVASDGTVYGEFYNSDLSGLELGIADYNTLTRTTIGTLTKSYVALGVTSDKKIYGVASDGNLYQISATDATETLVGPTGVTIADADGSYYGQSGEIDYRTNIFYWAAINNDGECALYTVDLATGAATKVSDFPAEEQIYALTVPDPAAVDDAPAMASDVALAFEGASLSGSVSFTAPTKTYGGGDLSGSLTYYIVAGNDTIGTGTTTAGASVTKTVTVPADGSIRFKVTTANSFGSSPKAIVTKYVGYDTPEAIESVKLNADEKTGKVTLSWSAPKVGLNGGYVGELKYDVVRYPDSVTVAAGLADTVFTETLSATELKAYSYGVIAINGTKRGAETTSSKAVIGPAIVPPYENTFDGDAFDLMTIVDANNDGRTWFLYNYYGADAHARCQYNGSLDADDWLLTPTLKLEAGKEYVVSFDASNYLSYYTERIEVKYGNGSDPTAYKGVILEPTELTSDAYTKFSKAIIPDADEEIKIGFHSMSDADMYYLKLDNIKVSEGSALTAPDSVTAITAVAGANGAPTATVSFTLPTKTINGTAVSAIAKAEILRDGVVVGTVTSGLTPGGSASFTDTNVPSGTHTYSVRVYNENGGGRYSEEISIYVGIDTPGAVARDGVKLADNTTSVGLSWDAVTTGANGGYVNPNEMWYNVFSVDVDDYGYADLSLLDSIKAKTSYDVPYLTNEGDQKLVYFALSAKNEMGESSYTMTNSIVCGKPYTIPFREQFAVSGLAYDLWWASHPGNSSWGLLSGTSTDGAGGGAAVFNGTGDVAYFATGKISIAGATNPKLVFSSCSDANSDATISVLIRRFDGSVDSIAAVDYNAENTAVATKWAKTSVSLAKYMNDPYIVVQFRGEGNTEGYIYLDDVNVRDVYENDLAAEISAPESVKKGENATVNVKVTNFGDNAASAYTVKLYAGSTLVETKEVTEPLASFESTTFTFDYKTSAFDESSSVELSAVVDFANELNPDDNTASTTIELLTSTKPAPASVSATQNGGNAEVAWTAPATTKQEVTEDFESYATWSIDKFGDWTCYDGDKGASGSMFNSYEYGHQGEAFAFEIWEPEAIFEGCVESNPTLAPHSGNKYAAALYSVGDNSTFPDADNWLISPTLSGDKQTVKFYAINQGDSETSYEETIVLLYATDGGADISTFVPVDTVVIDQNAWTEVTFDVPAGATNFAIHHVTAEGGFMLGIDDITYTAGAGTLVGYNIYRDGEFVGTVAADATSYIDANPADGSHTYAVTAVYADGESAPVSAAPVIISAIESVDAANGKTYNVYTVDGKHVGTEVKSLDGLKKGVYIVNDKKSIVK